MPYVTKEVRKQLTHRQPEAPGELAYIIYQAVVRYANKRPTFADLNAVVGVLDNVKHEFQRRHLDSYEDGKRRLHGDVF